MDSLPQPVLVRKETELRLPPVEYEETRLRVVAAKFQATLGQTQLARQEIERHDELE
jgi:hypothetical protein